ncbi:M20/M25/M40 family metallo-hydrolase [Bacillus sonorensis]|nr:M20/M25/M40 family metallo-hydrolase [Bacillus sonorensis]
MGSHLDTVENGGAYDGVYGLLAGLEAVRALAESGKRLTRPIELVNFTNEEGARFEPSMLASGVLAGRY